MERSFDALRRLSRRCADRSVLTPSSSSPRAVNVLESDFRRSRASFNAEISSFGLRTVTRLPLIVRIRRGYFIFYVSCLVWPCIRRHTQPDPGVQQPPWSYRPFRSNPIDSRLSPYEPAFFFSGNRFEARFSRPPSTRVAVIMYSRASPSDAILMTIRSNRLRNFVWRSIFIFRSSIFPSIHWTNQTKNSSHSSWMT